MRQSTGSCYRGSSDGFFGAFDSKPGEELWRFQTGFGADGLAATYELDGEEYFVIAAGGSRDGLLESGGDLVWCFKIGGPVNLLNGPRRQKRLSQREVPRTRLILEVRTHG